ncbi:hypothetical protein BGZ63DRAFT_409683 [Mariannaea sp. PMI_226]|nr:hypothetical protein BGZ63DRAFT_409683 [Mariannaea sp. PMI_226]
MNLGFNPPEIVLTVTPERKYSRPAVEFSVTLRLSRRPQGITQLRFPQALLWGEKRHSMPAHCSSDTLRLQVSLSRASHSENIKYEASTFKICDVCKKREERRANRGRQQTITDRVLVLNTAVTQPWQNCSPSHDTSNGSLFVKFKARILCECRHHSESLGFNLNCKLIDYNGAVIARGRSFPIMIKDSAFPRSRIRTHPFLRVLEPQPKNHMRDVDRKMLWSLTHLKYWKPSNLRWIDKVQDYSTVEQQ